MIVDNIFMINNVMGLNDKTVSRLPKTDSLMTAKRRADQPNNMKRGSDDMFKVLGCSLIFYQTDIFVASAATNPKTTLESAVSLAWRPPSLVTFLYPVKYYLTVKAADVVREEYPKSAGLAAGAVNTLMSFFLDPMIVKKVGGDFQRLPWSVLKRTTPWLLARDTANFVFANANRTNPPGVNVDTCSNFILSLCTTSLCHLGSIGAAKNQSLMMVGKSLINNPKSIARFAIGRAARVATAFVLMS